MEITKVLVDHCAGANCIERSTLKQTVSHLQRIARSRMHRQLNHVGPSHCQLPETRCKGSQLYAVEIGVPEGFPEGGHAAVLDLPTPVGGCGGAHFSFRVGGDVDILFFCPGAVIPNGSQSLGARANG